MARLPQDYREGWAAGTTIYRATARKRYTCRGNGSVGHAPDCTRQIEPGQAYLEYVGEVPAFAVGARICLPCALAFEYILRAEVAR